MAEKKFDILYTGAFRFPDLDAAAMRVLLVGECLRNNGRRVEYLSWSEGDSSLLRDYKGFKYRCMNEFRTRQVTAIFRLLGFLFLGRKTLIWLLKNRTYLKTAKIVILYNPPSFFAIVVYILSRVYGFYLVLDSTEWYESEHLTGGRFGIAAFENIARMKLVYFLFKNVISISSFLEKYYTRGRNINCLRLPALTYNDYSNSHAIVRENVITIIYAGNAGKKDRLKEVVDAVSYINNIDGYKVLLELYGPSLAEVEALLESCRLAGSADFIRAYGRVRREVVTAAYSKASFSVLFREHKRYALAGFPTKAVESWAAGVPIITNAIGDLEDYCNSSNSVILASENFRSGLVSFLDNYNEVMATAMHASCVDTANEFFSVEANEQRVAMFLSRLVR